MDEGQESRADRLCGGVSPWQWVSNGTRCLARGLTAPCVKDWRRGCGEEDGFPACCGEGAKCSDRGCAWKSPVAVPVLPISWPGTGTKGEAGAKATHATDPEDQDESNEEIT